MNGGPGAFWPEVEGPTKGFVDVIDQYQDIGVRSIRFHDNCGAGDMTQFFPIPDPLNIPDPRDENNYYWTETDKQFQKVVDGGFSCQLQLGQGWRNMASWAPFEQMKLIGYQLNPDNPTNYWPNFNEISRKVAPELFIKFLEHIWKKWNIEPNEDCYVEFWNEPNIQTINTVPLCPDALTCSDSDFLNTKFLNYEWDGTPLEFFELFAIYSKEIKTLYPKVKIGGPALWNPGADSVQHPCNKRWMDLFFDYVKKNNVKMDFICWTLYSDNPDDFIRNYTIIQTYLDDIGYSHTEQVISEYAINFGTETTLPNGRVIPNSLLAIGAATATSLWITLQKLDNLKDAFYYRGNDGPFVPNGVGFPIILTEDGTTITSTHVDNFGQAGVGMIHGNGELKPTAMAFKLWSKMADLNQLDFDEVIDYQLPYGGKIYLLAAKGKDCELVMLGSYINELSNMKATLSLKIKGEKALIDTVLDDRIANEEIHNTQNIWVQANTAFLITIVTD